MLLVSPRTQQVNFEAGDAGRGSRTLRPILREDSVSQQRPKVAPPIRSQIKITKLGGENGLDVLLIRGEDVSIAQYTVPVGHGTRIRGAPEELPWVLLDFVRGQSLYDVVDAERIPVR